MPGHPVEDVTLSHIRIVSRGGGTQEDAAAQPEEKENAYPEPSMFGRTPAHGWFIRHAKGIRMDHVQIGVMEKDMRPAVVVDDVSGCVFDFVETVREKGIPFFVLKKSEKINLHECTGVDNWYLDKANMRTF
jgi:hypothetical protein